MKKKSLSLLFLIVLISVYALPLVAAGKDAKGGQGTSSPLGTPVRTYLNINNISTVLKNDGIADIDVNEQNSGLVFPKGSGKTAAFQTGFLWGGRVGGEVRVGGSAYRTGLQAGRILSPGVAEDPNLPKNRIYRVRADYKTGDLSTEVREEGKSAAEVRAQYEKDWNEWPATEGAPYKDVDSNGTYNPTKDIPGVAGADQTVWFVCNDLSSAKTTFLYGSSPIGLELQVTVWAYAQQGALGNMFFKKFILVNKSTTPVTEMYVTQWSDIDLGNSTDDFAGCDTTLSLGYVYNAFQNDDTYRPSPPPAVGFDFFQGPIVPAAGQTARFKGALKTGFKNLPMTAFYYFARGDANVTDPTQGSQAGTTQFYNFMQGRIGLTGAFFQNPQTRQSTTFALSGNPQTGQGWIDGQVLPPGDRRMGVASGPFTMAVGDTQEIVVAEICAGATEGVDRLKAIGLLKFYDLQAQGAYDNFFRVPSPPPAPELTVAELDKEIVLSWGENKTAVTATEGSNSFGFKFQGYNIYQLPSASATKDAGVRVATFDIKDFVTLIPGKDYDPTSGLVLDKVQQFGTDVLQRYVSIKTDALKGNIPLVNGIRYYFAVTAYNYFDANPAAVPNNLESPLAIKTIVPHSPNPGVRYPGGFGDTIATVTHTSSGALSDGNVIAQIVDPTRLTGQTYQVKFDTAGGGPVWNLYRGNEATPILKNQTNQNGDDTSPIIDGMIIRVFGPALNFKNFEVVANGAGPLVPSEGGAANFAGFPNAADPTTGQQVSRQRWLIHTADNGSRGDYTAFLDRTTRSGTKWSEIIPSDYELRFTAAGGWAYDAFNTGTASFRVPFELWNIGVNTPNNPSDDYRMIPWLLDDDGDGTFNMGGPGTKSTGTYDHSVSGGENDPYTDWIYWTRPASPQPGDAGYRAAEAAMIAGTYDGGSDFEVMARMVLVAWNGGTAPPYAAPLPEPGTIFRITTTKPNTRIDRFTIQVPPVAASTAIAKQDVGNINVFPNPYYGVNSEEINKYQRFVTFNHLPQRAIIRIFNLAGVLVRTVNHESATSQFERWNLANDSGLPVGSGIYIAHIEMPELGITKILKLAIVQEQQVLDRF